MRWKTAFTCGIIVVTIISAASFVLAQENQPQPGTYCVHVTQNLKRGDRDATTNGQVTELQKFLSDYYDLNPDDYVTGYFGRLTQQNVIRFQREQNLPAFGYVGPLTRAAVARVCGSGGNVLVNFSVTPLSGPAPLEVSFSGGVPVTLFGYNLQYGDGTTRGIECNPGSKSGCTFNFSHIYTNIGTYTVTLTEAAKPPVGTLGTVTITVGGSTRGIPSADGRAAVTLTSDRTTVTNGGTIRFTATVTNAGTSPLIFFDEKSGQCQSSQFTFTVDGKNIQPSFNVPGVCAGNPPVIITLVQGQTYSVEYGYVILPVPSGSHVANVQVRLWGPGNGVFWEGTSNNLNFIVQ